jgi:TfuA-like protein
MNNDKILVYLGPSLPLKRAREILPHAIYRLPAKQGDIVTDVVHFEPNIIILIDGVFRDNLSPWHKEFTWALQYPSVTAIYGAASMGALRAAELDWLGMIGVGKIYGWYRDGVTEDDSEVALTYAVRDSTIGPLYYPNTVPLVDIRAANPPPDFLAAMSKVYYGYRTEKLCQDTWGQDSPFPRVNQKALDAEEVLQTFREYSPEPLQKPTPDNLSRYFYALYERDRRIKINGIEIPQQHIDAHVLLHHPEYERICSDALNQELALMLCDILRVMVSVEEIERENVRFQQKNNIETQEAFKHFLEVNGWSRAEYDRVMIQNARIRKLQHALTVSKMYRRNTLAILDYLRTQGGFDYWAREATKVESRIQARGADDWLTLNEEQPAFGRLADHFEREGLELKCNFEEYLLETGFSNVTELGVALSRTAAGAKDG